MAWDWLKDNNDEPNEFKPIDARGLLDGKEYHDYWTTKLHNGLANVPKSLLGAVESIPAMAARTRPVVMQELENVVADIHRELTTGFTPPQPSPSLREREGVDSP